MLIARTINTEADKLKQIRIFFYGVSSYYTNHILTEKALVLSNNEIFLPLSLGNKTIRFNTYNIQDDPCNAVH